MNELLSAAQMKQADSATIAGGIPGITLMEAAGRAVADTTAELFPDGPVLVLAGPGNNGGDGFIAARRLMSAGRQVTLALLGDPARLAGDAAIARDRWPGEIIKAATPLPPAAIIIDALFGTGLDRPVTGPAEALIAAMNDAPAPVVAVAMEHIPVLVVDDGSQDGTAQAAQDLGAQVIQQIPNQGKGVALRRGFQEALAGGYEAVITLDADRQQLSICVK